MDKSGYEPVLAGCEPAPAGYEPASSGEPAPSGCGRRQPLTGQAPRAGWAASSSRALFACARDLTLRTSEGCPFAGVDLDIPAGSLFAIRGRAGSGRTSLLLTLAGRMLPTSGSLSVLGFELPRYRAKVLRRVGLAEFPGVTDLPETLSVRAVTASELALYGRKAKVADAEAYLDAWDMAHTARMDVRDLSAEARVRLAVALALAGGAEAVAVDSIEDGLTGTQSQRLMDFLHDVSRGVHTDGRRITVMLACTERGLALQADGMCSLG